MAGGIGVNRLSDLGVRKWIRDPEREPKRLFDGHGLFLMLTPKGSPVWRMKYRFGARDQVLAIGVYPDVTLADARDRRDEARALLKENRDPLADRRAQRAAAVAATGNTLEEVTRRWLAKNQAGWQAVTYDTTRETLDRHVLKYLGHLPVGEITTPMVASVYERVAKASIDTSHRVARNVSRIFNLAIALGLCTENPATAAVEMLPRKRDTGRRPAFLTWPELGAVLRQAESAHLSPAVRMAHRLIAFTGARMGTVIRAEWLEFQLDAEPALWVIPREKMKMRDRAFPHKVVLGPTILAELREWHRVTGGTGYLFPAVAGEGAFITPESIEKAYRVTLGLKGKHTPHGWRAALSTLARDNDFDRDAVEMALDHVHDNAVARAYDRGERLTKRVELARWWNEQLAAAERGAP